MAISSKQFRPPVTERARKRMPRVSVVVPARNEAANLPHVLPAIPRFAREVILVDGHSSDDTIEVARKLRPDIIVVQQTGKGKGDALREGFAAATGDIIVMIDADGSTDPREIPRFVRPLLAGADFVKGSRFAAHGGSADITWFRQLGNAGLNTLVNALFGTRYTDLCYGYNAFWRDCLDCFEVDCQGFEVETLINLRAHKANLKIVEAPSFERSRIHGQSNLNTMRDGWRVLKMIARERLNGASVVVDARYVMARTRRMRAFAPSATPEQTRSILGAGRGVSRSQRSERMALPAPTPVATTSVVLAAYTEARWDDLVAAVASLREQTAQPHEIILVVDHNRPLFERARATFGDVRVIENHQRQGLSGARNSGIAAATGELIAFLDDDAVAEPDWLERLAGICEDPQALGSGGWIQPNWRSGKPAWFPEEFHWVVGCSYRGLPLKLAATRNLIGASMCIRREVLEEIGGFRTDIGRVGANPMGCEETELCVRAQQRWPERTFLHQPRAVIHHAVPSARATWRYFRSRCFAEGRSKALMVRSVGRRDGLSSERAYTLRTLPIGVLRGLVDAISHRDLSGLGRAGAIIAGLALTLAGYVTATSEMRLAFVREWLSAWATTASIQMRLFGASVMRAFGLRTWRPSDV